MVLEERGYHHWICTYFALSFSKRLTTYFITHKIPLNCLDHAKHNEAGTKTKHTILLFQQKNDKKSFKHLYSLMIKRDRMLQCELH